LIEVVVRSQGRDAAGHQDLILRTFPDGSKKYCQNYINLEINNFTVTEKGSLRDSIIRGNHVHLVQDAHNNNQPL
jgi:hypothetical protein